MTIKAILVNPPIREWSRPNVPPMGLLLISRVLREAGHDVVIHDINATRAPLEDVADWTSESPRRVLEWMRSPEAECDMLGIGGLITQWNYIRWFSEQYKKLHPKTIIVAGGPVVSNAPDLFSKRMSAVDAIVVGEGELAVLQVVADIEQKKLTAKRDVRITTQPIDAKTKNGLQWEVFSSDLPVYQAGEQSLDPALVPLPDYENLKSLPIYLHNPVGYKNQKRKWVDGGTDGEVANVCVISTRGCVFRCRFCQPRYMTTTARARPIDKVLDELETVIDRYGVRYVHFCDEITFFSKARARHFADAMIERGLHDKIEWGCPTRIDTLDRPVMERLRKAGMVWMGLGVESLSEAVLKAMDKYVHIEGGLERVIENLRAARAIFPVVDTSFIVGYPGETRETLQETIRNMHRVGEDFRPDACFYSTPYPQTWLWDHALKNGYIKDPIEYIESMGENSALCLLNFTDIPQDELRVWKRRVEQATLGEPVDKNLQEGPMKWANISYSYPV
jgi:radical SAM superfamily enzyme YgiQ (UPF0313 family)